MAIKSLNPVPTRCRFVLSLIALLLPLTARHVLAQVTGEVETIGYENYFRPTAWTPMIVQLTPKIDTAADYQIRVYQSDLDRDQPIFTRQVTVTGTSSDGSVRDQRFRMYFKATPLDGGLPDANDPGTTIASLQKKLSVRLYSTNNKFITELPLTSTVFNVDASGTRGSKFILAVTGGHSLPARGEYNGSTTGLLEDVNMVAVKTDALPENPIGYDGIDAILWLDADPADLSSGGDEKMRALQQYVRKGGDLVICQQAEQWQRTLGFGELLPVMIDGVRSKGDAEPLQSLAAPPRQDMQTDPWQSLKGPMILGVARPKPGGIVDTWIYWPNDPASPYLARHSYGCGCVTWVAQDLGAPRLVTAVTSNWPVVWKHVFNWQDTPMNTARITKSALDDYGGDYQTLNLGGGLIGATDLPGKGLGLIALAVLSFILYWLVAGPGTYFFLLSRKQTGASWFAFAAVALVFTLLAALLVRVVLRGPPELKHLSLARTGSGDAVHVYSRLGLYIPHDGDQTLTVAASGNDNGGGPGNGSGSGSNAGSNAGSGGVANGGSGGGGAAASLTAFAVPPMASDQSDDIGQPYTVPIPDALSDEGDTLHVPFRSTMKKFEASWNGPPGADTLAGAIEGSVKRTANVSVAGKLTNGTGQTLVDVYIAYRWKAPGNGEDRRNGDYMLYLPFWLAGQTLDIYAEFHTQFDDKGNVTPVPRVKYDGMTPGRGQKCVGNIQTEWDRYWLHRGPNLALEDTLDIDQSLIMLSVFQRLPADRRTADHTDRFELSRRGAHRFDASAVLASGSMLIVAHSDPRTPDPVPLPLDVNGDRVKGDGVTLYQFLVPVDNDDMTPPSTRPQSP